MRKLMVRMGYENFRDNKIIRARRCLSVPAELPPSPSQPEVATKLALRRAASYRRTYDAEKDQGAMLIRSARLHLLFFSRSQASAISSTAGLVCPKSTMMTMTTSTTVRRQTSRRLSPSTIPTRQHYSYFSTHRWYRIHRPRCAMPPR